MQTVINEGKIVFTVAAFISTMSLEDKMYLAERAIHDKDVLRKVVEEILDSPKPCYYEARMLLLERGGSPYKRLVQGLLSKIEVLTRSLRHANDRALKYYYAWPADRIEERPRHIPFEAEIPIPDSDLDEIIASYFERRKNGISNGS
jgi:hypothetical protein